MIISKDPYGLGTWGAKMNKHDVEFTHNQIRYTTDADTFRILFEALGTAFEAPIILAGLQNKKIKKELAK